MTSHKVSFKNIITVLYCFSSNYSFFYFSVAFEWSFKKTIKQRKNFLYKFERLCHLVLKDELKNDSVPY